MLGNFKTIQTTPSNLPNSSNSLQCLKNFRNCKQWRKQYFDWPYGHPFCPKDSTTCVLFETTVAYGLIIYLLYSYYKSIHLSPFSKRLVGLNIRSDKYGVLLISSSIGYRNFDLALCRLTLLCIEYWLIYSIQ